MSSRSSRSKRNLSPSKQAAPQPQAGARTQPSGSKRHRKAASAARRADRCAEAVRCYSQQLSIPRAGSASGRWLKAAILWPLSVGTLAAAAARGLKARSVCCRRRRHPATYGRPQPVALTARKQRAQAQDVRSTIQPRHVILDATAALAHPPQQFFAPLDPKCVI